MSGNDTFRPKRDDPDVPDDAQEIATKPAKYSLPDHAVGTRKNPPRLRNTKKVIRSNCYWWRDGNAVRMACSLQKLNVFDHFSGGKLMAWTKPSAREIKCGMEINMYGPGEDDERDTGPDQF